MSSDEVPGKDIHDEKSSSSSIPTDDIQYNRTISQDLRYLDDALTHAIDQLTTFNSETMSDLSLKYEYIRNNEVSMRQPSIENEHARWFFFYSCLFRVV